MIRPKKIIAFLTDFGLSDPYVGICKGVVASINPEALVVDITHLVCPQDILQAVIYLKASIPSFPKGTIYLCIVDPGVGSDRAPLVIRRNKDFFVGPDNGILSPALKGHEKVVNYKIEKERLDAVLQDLNIETRASFTFHARDIFAPAAALLSRGIGPEDFCSLMRQPPRAAKIAAPKMDKNEIEGSIVYFDHFGNGATNIASKHLSLLNCPKKEMRVKAETKKGKELFLPLGQTFSSVEKGEAVAYVNSFGFVEIAVNGENAKKCLNLARNAKVKVICQA